MTVEPKLSITNKPVVRPLGSTDMLSVKECELSENFQIFTYYLANTLYSLLPLMQEAVRLRVTATGVFNNVEDPLKALRFDKMVRHMNMNVFT
jgi:hypothetical protein